MLDIDIYQTLENRGNDTDVENQGPFICRQYNEDGSLKQGIREPWLGEGYYFGTQGLTMHDGGEIRYIVERLCYLQNHL